MKVFSGLLSGLTVRFRVHALALHRLGSSLV